MLLIIALRALHTMRKLVRKFLQMMELQAGKLEARGRLCYGRMTSGPIKHQHTSVLKVCLLLYIWCPLEHSYDPFEQRSAP